MHLHSAGHELVRTCMQLTRTCTQLARNMHASLQALAPTNQMVYEYIIALCGEARADGGGNGGSGGGGSGTQRKKKYNDDDK